MRKNSANAQERLVAQESCGYQIAKPIGFHLIDNIYLLQFAVQRWYYPINYNYKLVGILPSFSVVRQLNFGGLCWIQQGVYM